MSFEQILDAPVDVTSDDVRIGISACLLGHEVRMNGGHCRKPWLTEVLGTHATFVPVALVRHLLLSYEAPAWAREQVYLQPFDDTLHVNEAM